MGRSHPRLGGFNTALQLSQLTSEALAGRVGLEPTTSCDGAFGERCNGRYATGLWRGADESNVMPESILRLATGDGHRGRKTPLRFLFSFQSASLRMRNWGDRRESNPSSAASQTAALATGRRSPSLVRPARYKRDPRSRPRLERISTWSYAVNDDGTLFKDTAHKRYSEDSNPLSTRDGYQ